MAMKRIAIIGGGAAGLGAAYFLQGQQAADGSTCQCTVFEKNQHFGGNALTAYLGDKVWEKPFADLGVNDFNKKTYTTFDAILSELKARNYPVAYAPLLDTTTFYVPPGFGSDVSYTMKELQNPDENPDKPYLESFKRQFKQFEDVAYKVLTEPKYFRMTVDEFIADQGFTEQFALWNLKARIQNMYYIDDRGPGGMPIYGVMKYYHLQEGLGDRETAAARDTAGRSTTRMYFQNGASSWIHALEQYLRNVARVELRPGAEAMARFDGGTWTVLPMHGGGNFGSFDVVISAVYAESVGAVIAGGATNLAAGVASRFRYSDSLSVVHDFEDVMPVRGQRSTYNIVINPPDRQQLRPYVINYVANMHQGRNDDGPPFVSLCPITPVPNEDVRQMWDWGGMQRKVMASAFLRHNTLSYDNLIGQSALQSVQGTNNLYFTGGWTIGAGLHEEVLRQGQMLSKMICGTYEKHHSEHPDPDDPGYVPRHIRETRPDMSEA
ncbi:NAD(P)-binding protein [Rhodobacteraceae bacterium 2CG4]|uniref:NAD(P)-binding protein n=1 Tax=Halovulum marinum TaxID=2662447 RepID=A0A6L5Z2H4_9RHOB|nr:NAD(P)-binding protein [Halovulum marinum]MSU90738.1 NAD(P)-binding protein [Halovulum marinum]